MCSACVGSGGRKKNKKIADNGGEDDKASTSTGSTDVEASSISEEAVAKKHPITEKSILRHLVPHPKAYVFTHLNTKTSLSVM